MSSPRRAILTSCDVTLTSRHSTTPTPPHLTPLVPQLVMNIHKAVVTRTGARRR